MLNLAQLIETRLGLGLDNAAMMDMVTHYGDVIMGTVASQITSLTIIVVRLRSKKTPKLCVAGIVRGIPPVTGEFPVQMASNAENVSIWWRHHAS